MRLIAFADSTLDLEGLTGELDGMSVSLANAPDDAYGTPGNGPAAETASALIASERVLVERRPAAVVLAGAANSVLGAGLAASKLEIPLIRLTAETAASGDGEQNSRLLGLLADLVVDVGEKDPAGTIHAWLATASARSGGPPASP